MKYSDYPLQLLKDLQELNESIRAFVTTHSDLIEIDSQEIETVVICKGTDWYFKISKPVRKGDDTQVTLEYAPFSKKEPKAATVYQPAKEVINYLDRWVHVIRGYMSISLNGQDKILKQFEEEFYSDLKLLDADADEVSFEYERQLGIYELLEHNKKLLEQGSVPGNVKDLIEEATEIQSNLQNYTKNETVRKLSSWYARVRKQGIPLIKLFWDESKKFAIKKMLEGGFGSLDDLINKLM